MQSLVRRRTWPRGGSDTQGELPGNARRCNQGREDIDRKVRTER